MCVAWSVRTSYGSSVGSNVIADSAPDLSEFKEAESIMPLEARLMEFASVRAALCGPHGAGIPRPPVSAGERISTAVEPERGQVVAHDPTAVRNRLSLANLLLNHDSDRSGPGLTRTVGRGKSEFLRADRRPRSDLHLECGG